MLTFCVVLSETGYFWGGLCACCAVWTYFRCPEPRGRTYGTLSFRHSLRCGGD